MHLRAGAAPTGRHPALQLGADGGANVQRGVPAAVAAAAAALAAHSADRHLLQAPGDQGPHRDAARRR